MSEPKSAVVSASVLASFIGKRPALVPLDRVEAVHAFIATYVLCSHSRGIFDAMEPFDRTMVSVELGPYIVGAFSRAAPLGYGRVRLTLTRFAFPSASCKGMCAALSTFEVHP